MFYIVDISLSRLDMFGNLFSCGLVQLAFWMRKFAVLTSSRF